MNTLISHQTTDTELELVKPVAGMARESAIPSVDAIPLRIRDIAVLRGLGYSYRKISKPLGVSPQAVSLMLARYRHRLGSIDKSIELLSLSGRAANALGRYGITSRQQAKERNILDLLRHEKNCGRKTIGEIERWLEEQ